MPIFRCFALSPLLVALTLGTATSMALEITSPVIARAQSQDLDGQADRLFNEGIELYQADNWQQALTKWQRALELYRQAGNNIRELNTLNRIGGVYQNLEDYSNALQYYEESLSIARLRNDHEIEAHILNNIAVIYQLQGNYLKTLQYQQKAKVSQLLQQGIEQFRQSFHPDNTGQNISDDLKVSIQTLLDCLHLIKGNREVPDENAISEHEATQLLSVAYYLSRAGYNLEDYGEYESSLNALQESLNIYQFLELLSIDDIRISQLEENEISILNFIGWVYYSLGQYDSALSFNQQSIERAKRIGQSYEIQLADIGLTYQATQNYEEALRYANQALTMAKETGNTEIEAFALSDLGNLYYDQNDFSRAVQLYEESIRIAPRKSHRWTVVTVNDLGKAYQGVQDYNRAAKYYLRALTTARSLGFRAVEAQALSNLGNLMEEQNQIELATVFYKRSVNIIEEVRQDSLGLSREQRQSYAETVETTYRALADVLLKQGRILEAQRTLELLKVEEIREFTRATYTTNGIQYDPLEQTVVDSHGSIIVLGEKISACDPNCDQELYDQQIALEENYVETVDNFEEIIRQSRADDNIFYDPENLSSEALDLVNAQPGTVLIYPIVLEDRLWLLWTSTGGVVGSVEVTTTNQTELSHTVQQFRELINEPDSVSYVEFKKVSQKLYDWLITPLENELETHNIQQLIFAQDRVTRYMPMAALYDGEQYLIERYTVSTVLSAALTDTNERLGDVNTSYTLGLGVSQAFPPYGALPNVSKELDAVVKTDDADQLGIYPGQVFLNDAFTPEVLKQNVRRSRILHIATHAEFVPGTKDASFILLGNGERLEIKELESLKTQFSNLHLVILSACQTALGGESLDGTEIAGVSSYFLGKNKAEAVLATLWKVDDAGTSLLMQRFYEFMASGELTKAEALKHAQLSLLNDEANLTERFDKLGIKRGGLVNADTSDTESVGLSHPYYWAPFILIGNSL